MAIFTRFEDIRVWQKSRLLCHSIYQISNNSDLRKDYKLKDQINGSSGSVMDNIAEGFGRGGNTEFIQFLEISHASACETQSQLYRVLDRKYIQQGVFEELYNLVDEIKKMILSLIKYLQSSEFKGPKFKNRL